MVSALMIVDEMLKEIGKIMIVLFILVMVGSFAGGYKMYSYQFSESVALLEQKIEAVDLSQRRLETLEQDHKVALKRVDEQAAAIYSNRQLLVKEHDDFRERVRIAEQQLFLMKRNCSCEANRQGK